MKYLLVSLQSQQADWNSIFHWSYIYYFWMATINVNWPMECFNFWLAVISNLWTQKVHYTISECCMSSPEWNKWNGINLCGITPVAPGELIFSMPIDKEGTDTSRMKSETLESFCYLSSYFHILLCRVVQ